ncbi:AbrB/MazE/SpoVT family DNA-binding domain-containing protein [Halobellus clavatus]|jgi:phosphate uptake regulator|uniref:Phosphate uptake regulator n=1 Tax=Halobellus clavatus TaxID=660517 RepID=A0A1H3JKQ2_9EURY|nr:hypothetical protein [Halobellus clavatus]SDY40477.1 Phosphate uptake regulator [Halobellus clavatus]
METRKIQQVSNGTFTVSLPREWATEQGLSAGDVVDLHAHLDGVLVIQTDDAEIDELRVSLSCDERPGRLRRVLEAAYATGAREIRLEGDGQLPSDHRTAIRSAVRAMAGVTIGAETDEHVLVQSVLDADAVSVRQSLRQLQFVALSRHRTATSALCDPDQSLDSVGGGTSAERCSAMIERYFVRSLTRLDEVDTLGESRLDLFRFYRTARELANVAAHAEQIANIAVEVDADAFGREDPSDTTAAIEAAAADAREAVEVAADAVAGPSPGDLWSVFERRDAVRQSVDAIERRLFETAGADYRVAQAVAAIRQTADCAASIAEVGVRRAVREGVRGDDPAAAIGPDGDTGSRVADGAEE